MTKLLPAPIKIFALILCIASFALPVHQVNAQETEIYQPKINENAIRAVKSTRYEEISTSLGNVFYADPTLWNNDQYNSIGYRFVIEQDGITGFFDFNIATTNSKTSPIDGLRRQSSYQKFIAGTSFEKNRAPTRFYVEYGFGLIKTRHSVQGNAAWRSSESDETYGNQIIYENAGPFLISDAGVFAHLEFGIRVQNLHKFSLYIQPIIEGTLTARADTSYGKNDGDEPGDNYYYGEIPDEIINGMIGFRYSYILPKSWDKTSFERRRFNPHDEE